MLYYLCQKLIVRNKDNLQRITKSNQRPEKGKKYKKNLISSKTIKRKKEREIINYKKYRTLMIATQKYNHDALNT